MKLKSLNRSANCCWSPEEVTSGIYLAAGTTAQQVDASFSITSQLEILSLDVASPDKELKPIAATGCDQRFHKIVWTPFNIPTTPMGTIAGGTENGTVQLYDVQRLISNEKPLIAAYQNHSGPVHALDFNPFQTNLLASGSRESEVNIWDLSSTEAQAFSPGSPSQPLEDVVCLAWNRQVQHILASAMASRCVLWDLRKSEPIIRVSDSSSRFRCKAVAWNPQVPTQLCLASEDDHCPWLQIWDLRYASSPVKTLEKHQKGILSISWNAKDQDMLVSCGKGGSVCIWNPNGAQGSELISELCSTTSWNNEVQWCPRNPAVVSISSLSGEVGVYSVLGGEHDGGGDNLRKAPSWLSGGIGAQFGFGGKLITFSKDQGTKVDVTQVGTDDLFIDRVKRMEAALFKQQLQEDNEGFWDGKLQGTHSQLWTFLRAFLETDPNERLRELLGFSAANLTDETEDLSTAFENSVTMNGLCKDTTSAHTIVKSLIAGNISRSVNLCLKSRRFAEALFLADYAGDPSLKETIRKDFLNANRTDPMCRLVACVSSGLWEELADLAPIDEWKTTVAAVLGHVNDLSRSSNICSTIGAKLQSESQHESALYLSIVARNLSQLSDCYIALYGLPETNETLQDYMEVMTAAKILTKASQLPKAVSRHVGTYVKLLAEQGCLSTSLYYLNDLDTEDSEMSHLRDRILQSQGLTTSKTAAPAAQPNQFARQGSRVRTLSSASMLTEANHPMAPPMNPGQFQEPTNDYQGRPPSRCKYPAVVDPSLKANVPSYGNYGYGGAAAQPSNFNSIPLGNFQAVNPMGNFNPVSPANFTPSVDPVTAYPGQVYESQVNNYGGRPPSSLSQTYPSVNQYGGNQYSQVQAPAVNLVQGNDYTRDSRYSAPGWNDPPSIRRSSKPLVVPPAAIPEAVPNFFTTESVAPEQIFTPQPVQQFVQAPPPQPLQPEVEKGPIPVEYDCLYTTFERLRVACLVLDSSLLRKKLDDVHGKLEQLGDKLREYALSDNTIQNLQLIVTAVQHRDYNQALQLFAHVAQTCNMSETSAFLPGIKTLITIAQQNQIYA